MKKSYLDFYAFWYPYIPVEKLPRQMKKSCLLAQKFINDILKIVENLPHNYPYNSLPKTYFMAKYSKKSQDKVEKSMKEMKQGKLMSGRSGKKVTSRKQAIAIGLSEARAEGAKVPKKSGSKSGRKSASKSRSRKSSTSKSS